MIITILSVLLTVSFSQNVCVVEKEWWKGPKGKGKKGKGAKIEIKPKDRPNLDYQSVGFTDTGPIHYGFLKTQIDYDQMPCFCQELCLLEPTCKAWFIHETDSPHYHCHLLSDCATGSLNQAKSDYTRSCCPMVDNGPLNCGTPTMKPTLQAPLPTRLPTRAPTSSPTRAPTANPTRDPTERPTRAPTANPTRLPTKAPSDSPTVAPTKNPTRDPTDAPTRAPTDNPTLQPTAPTRRPTDRSDFWSHEPTESPTDGPATQGGVVVTAPRTASFVTSGANTGSVNAVGGAGGDDIEWYTRPSLVLGLLAVCLSGPLIYYFFCRGKGRKTYKPIDDPLMPYQANTRPRSYGSATQPSVNVDVQEMKAEKPPQIFTMPPKAVPNEPRRLSMPELQPLSESRDAKERRASKKSIDSDTPSKKLGDVF